MNPKADIKVEVHGDKVFVFLTLQNLSSDAPVWVEKSKVISAPEIRAKLFQIITGDGEIPYIGVMAKRRAPGPDDFFEIKPGGQIYGGADISGLYQFLPGSHQYMIRYKAFHADPRDPEKLLVLESNTATFTYAR